jgi:hypothetical protein
MAFLDKEIYIYQSQRITESLQPTVDSYPDKFVLAKITGFNDSSQTFRLSLVSKEERVSDFCKV